MTTETRKTFNEQEVKAATTEIRTAFIADNPIWNACGEQDSMGIYRFLTGRNNHTMSHLFEQLKKPIAIIITYGEHEIEKARLAIAA